MSGGKFSSPAKIMFHVNVVVVILLTRGIAVGCVQYLIKDGGSTLLWSDPWLPGGPLGGHGVLLAEALGRDTFDCVKKLFHNGDIWENVTADLAIEARWAEVVNTKIHSRLPEDMAVWTPTANGAFSLRTAWDVVRIPGAKLPWCDLVWFPSSQLCFSFITWLACLRKLTTRCLLAQWGLVVDTACVLCQDGTDSLDHLLFRCSFSAGVWREVLHLNGFNRGPLGTWDEEVRWLVKHFIGCSIYSRVRRFSFTASVYKLWQERNARIFMNKCNSAASVLQCVLSDTRGVFVNFTKPIPDDAVNRAFFSGWGFDVSFVHPKASFHVWTPPPRGWVVLNCDDSVRQDRGGYGVIGRDHRGCPIFAVAGGARDVSIVHMELQAIKAALLHAKSHNLSHVQVRSDSMMAIQMIVGSFHISWSVRWLIEDIWRLRDSFSNCSFAHQVRETNGCADYLVSLVDSPMEISLCIDSLPLALSTFIQNDAGGKRYLRM
ncbi:uncharacterized protein LOC122645251 [Telopea speciosissima]|uniref:uncharacterized protein LOC122645251 n=1 Tax=Telopea speciosissima TaxID=54955 RepID=UPI001CC3465D|nr:uncharacterized protein LOC122645251 [Telopea speciosissima]